ncbi:MAG: chemotaxis protein, partial [Deltaproteobacteria bacterium]|nr:chemotaxis protein [Deltaproteobacteria bacterium]
LLGGLCLLGVLAIAVGISVYSVRNTQSTVLSTSMANANKAAKAQLSESGKSVALEIKAELDVALDAARALADVFSCIKDESINLSIDRDRISGILRGILSKNETFLGTYTAWEPNALDDLDSLYQSMEAHDDTGRFIPYWSVGGDGQLVVDPLADYESTVSHPNGVRFGEYYLRPRERK